MKTKDELKKGFQRLALKIRHNFRPEYLPRNLEESKKLFEGAKLLLEEDVSVRVINKIKEDAHANFLRAKTEKERYEAQVSARYADDFVKYLTSYITFYQELLINRGEIEDE